MKFMLIISRLYDIMWLSNCRTTHWGTCLVKLSFDIRTKRLYIKATVPSCSVPTVSVQHVRLQLPSYKMKFVLVLVATFTVGCFALTDEQKLVFQKNYQQCVQGTGVNEELIKQMRAGTFADDPKLKTYIRCMFVKMGIMNEPGEMQIDVMKSLSANNPKPEETLEAAKLCSQLTDEDVNVKAFMVYKCFKQKTANAIVF